MLPKSSRHICNINMLKEREEEKKEVTKISENSFSYAIIFSTVGKKNK